MTVEILRCGPLTAQQVIAKTLDQAKPDDSVIVALCAEDGSFSISYSAIRPTQIAMVSVELAEIARQHARN